MEHVLHPHFSTKSMVTTNRFTPSTRRLLDGVAMPVLMETELSGAPDTLVDFTQAGVARRRVNPETRHVRARARAPFKGCGPRPHHDNVQEKYLPGLTWQPVSDKDCRAGRVVPGVLEEKPLGRRGESKDGDYSSKADLVAFVDGACRW